jgi:hypothetical protein
MLDRKGFDLLIRRRGRRGRGDKGSGCGWRGQVGADGHGQKLDLRQIIA